MEYRVIIRLDMRMRAYDQRSAAVEMPAHRNFLRCRFGVEIDQYGARLLPSPRKMSSAFWKGQSMAGRNVRPCKLTITSSLPLALMTVCPCLAFLPES